MPAVDAAAPHVELEASLPDDAAGYAARVHADAHRDVDPLGLTHDGHHLLLRARVRVKKARAARAEARVEEARVETRAEARVGARVEGRGKVGSGWVGVGEGGGGTREGEGDCEGGYEGWRFACIASPMRTTRAASSARSSLSAPAHTI